MRAHRAITMCLAFLLAGALSASCQDSLHAGERYVFVASNIDLPYWHEAQAGFKDAARTVGVRHPPQSGWLSEWGRLKGGRPGGLGVPLKRALLS